MSETLRDSATVSKSAVTHESSQSSMTKDVSGGEVIKAKMEDIFENVKKTKCPIQPHPTWNMAADEDADILYGLYALKMSNNKWDFSLEAYNLHADFSECPFEKVLPKDALEVRSMMPPIRDAGLRTEWIDVENGWKCPELGRQMVLEAMGMPDGLMLTQMRIFKEILWTAELDGQLGKITWDTSGVQGQYANYKTKPVSLLVHKSGPGYLHRSDNGFLCEVYEGKPRFFTEEKKVEVKQAKDGVADTVITETTVTVKKTTEIEVTHKHRHREGQKGGCCNSFCNLPCCKCCRCDLCCKLLCDCCKCKLNCKLCCKLPCCKLCCKCCKLPCCKCCCKLPCCKCFKCCQKEIDGDSDDEVTVLVKPSQEVMTDTRQEVLKGQEAEDGYVKTTVERVFSVDPEPGWRLTLVSQSPLHVHPPARQAEKNQNDTQQSPWFYIFDLSPHNSPENVFKVIASLRAAASREPLLIGGVPETVTYTDATTVLDAMLPANQKASMPASSPFAKPSMFGGGLKPKADEEPEAESIPGEVENGKKEENDLNEYEGPPAGA
eukprot:gnl/TRDRNA2_/TRDRNA2_177845_c0_seq3.p1 gnl/TRDRNA2_/TRDRNA2_177845_c0~~gnl/TRDRNA2_/TRDRNA2_177845_c0_seq3.p1  ORF type:complete len:575 (+),score=101.28 gnl/TRDRNA2_/TRDRNA2_177845_c0_seq3:79-1725(+)